jgi:hypothetical protein
MNEIENHIRKHSFSPGYGRSGRINARYKGVISIAKIPSTIVSSRFFEIW